MSVRKPFKKDSSTPKSKEVDDALHSTHTSVERFCDGHARPISRRMHTTQWLLEPEKHVLPGLFEGKPSGRGGKCNTDLSQTLS